MPGKEQGAQKEIRSWECRYFGGRVQSNCKIGEKVGRRAAASLPANTGGFVRSTARCRPEVGNLPLVKLAVLLNVYGSILFFAFPDDRMGMLSCSLTLSPKQEFS